MQNKQITTDLVKKDVSYIRGIGSYFSQIWSSSLHDQVPFYPLYFNQFLNRKLPVVVDINNLMLVYASVPGLRTVIDKKAELLKMGKFRIFKRSRKKNEPDIEIFYNPLLDLMKKPNCLPGGEKTFLEQWSQMISIYSTAFILKNKVGNRVYDLKLLPSGEMIINPTGYIFRQTSIVDMIETYEWMNSQNPEGGLSNFNPKEVMLYLDGPADRYLWGIPKIITNKIHVSNLDLSAKTSNVIMADRGALGILSNQAQDMAGAIPMDSEEQQKISKQYNREWGIGEEQSKVIVTNSNLKWQAIGYNRKELMLDETYELAFCAICDMYGIPRKMFADTGVSAGREPLGGDGKGKIEEAMKVCIETTIAMHAENFCDGFNYDPDYGLIQNDMYCAITFDHLAIMQDEKLDVAQEENYKAGSYSARTNAILALNAAVSTGQMQRDAAIATLVEIHQMEPAQAQKIILEPKKIQQLSPEEEESAKAMTALLLKDWEITRTKN